MKKLSKSLQLSKQSIQILDDRSLVDVKGGALSGDSCDANSCNTTCNYRSCNAEDDGIARSL